MYDTGILFFQSPAPSPFIKEMMDAGQFYTNRVLKDWKDKSKSHVEWTKAWLATLQVRQGFEFCFDSLLVFWRLLRITWNGGFLAHENGRILQGQGYFA